MSESPPAPLHVIDLGRARGCLGCALELVALGAVLAGFLGLVVSFVGSRGGFPSAAALRLTLSVSGTLLLLGVAGLWFVPRQLGVTRVELYPDHVSAQPLRRALSWRDVLGYDDVEGDRIRLRARVGDLVIPTPTELDRVAVLEFLEARGIPRDG